MKFLRELEKLRKNGPPGGNMVAVVETMQEEQALAQAGPSDKESDKQTGLRYSHVCHHYTFNSCLGGTLNNLVPVVKLLYPLV